MADREVIRCACGLNQFLTADGLCRKPDCRKRLVKAFISIKSADALLSGESVIPVALPLSQFYRPEFPFTDNGTRFRNGRKYKVNPRIPKDPLAEAEQAIDTLKTILQSNVRHKPRGRISSRSGLTVNDFPDRLRLAAIRYAEANGITLREVVIKSLAEMLDR